MLAALAEMKRKRPAPSILQRSAEKKAKSASTKRRTSKEHPSQPTVRPALKPWRCRSEVDDQAARAVARMLRAAATGDGGCSLKNLTLAPRNIAKAATHAVACETLKRMHASLRLSNAGTWLLMLAHRRHASPGRCAGQHQPRAHIPPSMHSNSSTDATITAAHTVESCCCLRPCVRGAVWPGARASATSLSSVQPTMYDHRVWLCIVEVLPRKQCFVTRSVAHTQRPKAYLTTQSPPHLQDALETALQQHLEHKGVQVLPSDMSLSCCCCPHPRSLISLCTHPSNAGRCLAPRQGSQ